MFVYLEFPAGPPSTNNHHFLFFGTFVLKTISKFGQSANFVHVTKIVKCQKSRMLCARYCYVCRAGIACSVICKKFTLRDFHITNNRRDQFMFEPTMKSWSGEIIWYSVCISKGVCFFAVVIPLHFSFVIHWMKSNFFNPENCSNFLQSLNAGSCKLCINKRWMFGVLEFITCCSPLQCSRISWKQVGINKWTLQILAFRNSMLLLTDRVS